MCLCNDRNFANVSSQRSHLWSCSMPCFFHLCIVRAPYPRIDIPHTSHLYPSLASRCAGFDVMLCFHPMWFLKPVEFVKGFCGWHMQQTNGPFSPTFNISVRISLSPITGDAADWISSAGDGIFLGLPRGLIAVVALLFLT